MQFYCTPGIILILDCFFINYAALLHNNCAFCSVSESFIRIYSKDTLIIMIWQQRKTKKLNVRKQ